MERSHTAKWITQQAYQASRSLMMSLLSKESLDSAANFIRFLGIIYRSSQILCRLEITLNHFGSLEDSRTTSLSARIIYPSLNRIRKSALTEKVLTWLKLLERLFFHSDLFRLSLELLLSLDWASRMIRDGVLTNCNYLHVHKALQTNRSLVLDGHRNPWPRSPERHLPDSSSRLSRHWN